MIGTGVDQLLEEARHLAGCLYAFAEALADASRHARAQGDEGKQEATNSDQGPQRKAKQSAGQRGGVEADGQRAPAEAEACRARLRQANEDFAHRWNRAEAIAVELIRMLDDLIQNQHAVRARVRQAPVEDVRNGLARVVEELGKDGSRIREAHDALASALGAAAHALQGVPEFTGDRGNWLQAAADRADDLRTESLRANGETSAGRTSGLQNHNGELNEAGFNLHLGRRPAPEAKFAGRVDRPGETIPREHVPSPSGPDDDASVRRDALGPGGTDVLWNRRLKRGGIGKW